MAIRAVQLDVYRTAIPMRSFEHAAASRNQAEAVLVRATFSDGVVGWGETLPRPYVTGESLDSVTADIEAELWPAIAALDFSGVEAEVAAGLRELPARSADGRCMNAALCAVELACVDAHMRRRSLSSPAGLIAAVAHASARAGAAADTGTAARAGANSNAGANTSRGDHPPHRPEGPLPLQGGGGTATPSDTADFLPATPGRIVSRVTGVLGSADVRKTVKRLRLMRWYGLADFKLKLGLGSEADAANLAAVRHQLRRSLPAGRCTLRVDVNGGWSADETPARTAELAKMGVCAVEQPVFCPAAELAALARNCSLPLIADESLLTAADADALLAGATAARTLAANDVEPGKVWWNVRISKIGGLIRAGELIAKAAGAGVTVVLGAMVGETSILSAAQRRVLQAAGGDVRFVEGNYGRLLLGGDVVRRSPRFGYGGRLRVARVMGLGAEVDPALVARWGRHVATLGR